MIKKFFVLMLCLLVIIPQSLYAEQAGESSQLENVIKKVKKKVEISDELEEFSYTRRGTEYYLNWEEEEGGESVFIQAELNGSILSYYHAENLEEANLAKVDYNKAEQAARTFLKQAVPEYEKNLVIVAARTPDKGNTYAISYQLMHSGIKVFGEKVTVEVDKRTGEVVSFSGIHYEEAAIYEAGQPVISLSKAEEKYLQQIGIRLAYQIRYSYDSEKTISFLAYEINNSEQKGISAETGDALQLYQEENNIESFNMATQDLSAEAAAGSSLTPSEQKAVDETRQFISAETLKTKWEACFKGIQKMTVGSSRLYQREQSYIREITCEQDEEEEGDWAELEADAVTGELLSYTYYNNDLNSSEKTGGQKWSQKEADKFIQQAAPDYFKEIRFKEVSGLEKEDENNETFIYERMVNGIPVTGDGITLTYNTALNEVTSFYRTWSKPDFKKPENILSPEEAIRKIGLELVYMKTDKAQYKLAYNHEEASMLLEPESGEVTDYFGNKRKEEVQGLYADIKGHPQEKVITQLFNSGIYLNKKVLNPDEAITQKELMCLLVRSKYWGDINEDEIYEQAYEMGLLEKQDKAPEQVITKEEGIYSLIKLTSFKKVADLEDIFVYPYKDQDASKQYKGAVAIGCRFGWLEKADYFYPKADLSKAQFMTYLYKLLETNYEDI